MNTRSAQGPRFLKRRLQATRGRAARGGPLDVRMRSRCAPARELSAASAMSCPMFPVLTLLHHASSHAQALGLLLPGAVAFLFTRTIAVRPSLPSLLSRRLHIRLPPFPPPPRHLYQRCCHRYAIAASASVCSLPSLPPSRAVATACSSAVPPPFRRRCLLHSSSRPPPTPR